jgi:hypothetical protein
MAVALNTGTAYDRIDTGSVAGLTDNRWIGRCKHCGQTHKIEGRLTTAHAPGRHDYVIAAHDGNVYTMAAHGSDTSAVRVPCGDHTCALARVMEGTKKSKHACGARCTNATGPNCDCRCRGANHGANC